MLRRGRRRREGVGGQSGIARRQLLYRRGHGRQAVQRHGGGVLDAGGRGNSGLSYRRNDRGRFSLVYGRGGGCFLWFRKVSNDTLKQDIKNIFLKNMHVRYQ